MVKVIWVKYCVLCLCWYLDKNLDDVEKVKMMFMEIMCVYYMLMMVNFDYEWWARTYEISSL